ncbi:uncharacterized protein LOC124632693 isoform X2 [Helicoverpa zea]|uniref:uncharacterized protein LOC124632693 isoform X2 n=1 Tax=Helicoverpa zea TaxID=7113 RepID=UPI001F5A65A0|nr:uncharacterized protein LOC124632693 isoform X2 [Helicoverpa zea]
MDSKTWRMGQKGRLKLSARRKKLKRSARGYFMNKENIPPVHETFQQSLQEAISAQGPGDSSGISSDTCHVLNTPSTPQSSPRESFKQIVVQAQIHEIPTSRPKNELGQNDPCHQIGFTVISTQTDWDIIESDVDCARDTPILTTQKTSMSTTYEQYEQNKSSESEYDTELYDISFDNENCGVTDCANLEGNRIINIAYLFQQLQNIRHLPFECNFQHLEFIKEKRIGFYSQFIFKCKLCNKIENIYSQDYNKEKKDIPINLNVIEGISQTGNGWSQLDEVCASLNMPNMSETYYSKYNKKLAGIQKDIALQLMLEAGAEERRLALEANDVMQGVPCVTVVTDGSWAKRSYGTNFNSLSGVGCIIGHRTKKILYIGVKNSYCSVCAMARNKKSATPTHTCFKNWFGSSTEMETSAIVDGFKASMEMHGVMFTKVIGDGDSSVMNALRDAMVYGPNINIRKIECTNHLLRNNSNKLRKTGKKTHNKVGFVPVPLRKALLSRIRRLHNAVTGAVAHAQELEATTADKLRVLVEDLRNGPCHVFGFHDSCKPYYCKRLVGEENLVPQLKSSGLWNDIFENLGWLIQNAESLLLKQTNNPAEQFNSIIAKFLAGKRVNFTRRGTYEARCFSAVGHYNTKDYSFLSIVQRAICPESSYAYTEKYINKMKSKLVKQRTRSELYKARGAKRAKRFTVADKHYGEVTEQEPDMPLNIFEKKKNDFLISLKLDENEIRELENKTLTQSNSDLWVVERKKRITASLFGQICKMKNSTPCTATLKNMLYSTFAGNDATRYGKAHEGTAIADLENKIGKKITPCGLFVCMDKPYLGASPDGLLGTDGLVEIKCPSSAAGLSPLEAVRQQKIKFCLETANGMKLKKTHNYYFQVQGQLMVTKRKFCYFVVWTPNGIEIDVIERDDEFWTPDKMSKLDIFYHRCVLPELIDPRYPRKLPFRDRF